LRLFLDVFEHVPEYLGFLTELCDRAGLFVFHIALDLCAWGVTFRSRWMLHMRETYGRPHYFSYETGDVPAAPAVAVFPQFNVLVLARGRTQERSTGDS
jgi:hypothetical protein